MTGKGQEEIWSVSSIYKNHQELSKWETKTCHCKPLYPYPIKLSKLLLLCYLVCKQADKLRKSTHDAKSTWPCAFPVYSSTGQSSGLLLQISRQSLLSPCSHSHSLLYLTYLEGREGCQACWWEKPKTNPVLQMSMLKAEQLQPPQILQANCVASLHLQGSRNTVPRPPAPLYWVEAEHHQLPRA